MKTITREEIARTLYDRAWIGLKDEKVTIGWQTFKRIVLETGLLSSIPTIRTKWVAVGGLDAFDYVEARNAYIVDLKVLRQDLGIPAVGEYVIKEADQ